MRGIGLAITGVAGGLVGVVLGMVLALLVF